VIDMQIDHVFADNMVEQAIVGCAEEHFAGDARRVRKALLRGECEYCRCVSNNLVRQIGEYLSQVDSTVKAVYQYQPAEDPKVPKIEKSIGIHFLLWVDHKSPALSALAKTLESVLADSQHKLGCPNASPKCYTLDMELVNDRDVAATRFWSSCGNPKLQTQLV
jgi:hypothetical protein